MDLKKEAQIHELRARRYGVREIARQLGFSPSTVSRTLTRGSDREQALDLISRVEMCEKKIALFQEALFHTHSAIGRVGPPYSHRMADLFKRWPDDYFKKHHFDGKL